MDKEYDPNEIHEPKQYTRSPFATLRGSGKSETTLRQALENVTERMIHAKIEPISMEDYTKDMIDSFNKFEMKGINFIRDLNTITFLAILEKYDLTPFDTPEDENIPKLTLDNIKCLLKDGLVLEFYYNEIRVSMSLANYNLVPKSRKKITLKQLLGE
jgi:hypothetical protein